MIADQLPVVMTDVELVLGVAVAVLPRCYRCVSTALRRRGRGGSAVRKRTRPRMHYDSAVMHRDEAMEAFAFA